MQTSSGHVRTHAGWLVPALVGLVAGSALQLAQTELSAGPWYAAMLAVAVALLAWPRLRGAAGAAGPLWLALVCALGAFGATGWRAAAFADSALPPALEGRDIRVTGIVAAMPQVNESGTRFRFQVERALLDLQPVPLPPRIYLGWYAAGVDLAPEREGVAELRRQPPGLWAGERWELTVRLKAPHGNSNPHGFDYELWLWDQGLQATGYVRAGSADAPARLLGQTWRHPVETARQHVRARILERLQDPQLAGLVAALVVGDQNAIERADWDVFRATGVAHLVSISGLHVTMFAWLSMALVGACWRRSATLCLRVPSPHAALVGGLLMAAAYAVFSGWGVPAQRTVWMLACAALLRLSGRRWPWPAAWLLACAVVVALDPWALTQAGFWLSFVAVGVLFASGRNAAGATPLGVRARLLGMLREQWVITLALAPLVLLLFGQVSVVGLAANALAIPWVTLLVTPLALLGVLWAPLWELAAWALAALLAWLELLAQLPFATWSVAIAPWWAGAAGLAGGVLLVLRLPPALRLAGLPLLLPVLLWQAPRPPHGAFELLAADIGQGNAVLVRTASHALLYDTGPRYSRDSDAGHRVLVPLLRALDVQLDMVVVSHRDSDHAGGALAVLALQPQAELRSSVEPGHALQLVRPVHRCEAGQHWRWDGVDFAVLHPAVEDYGRTARPNALSCVLRISSSQGPAPQQPARVALLVGDIERAQEQQLVAQAAPLRADFLLVPHHGSTTSSSAEFVDAVSPRWALVQAGYRNRFGHPAEAPMARYRARAIPVLDSAHCGALTWRSDTAQAPRCQRADGLRYWHHRPP